MTLESCAPASVSCNNLLPHPLPHSGIRKRQHAFVSTLTHTAQQVVGLSYELIIMQYSPDVEADVPVTQLWPWPDRDAFRHVRVITIPASYNPWPEKGRVWE